MNIDDQLLAEAKLLAARTHRTIGSVLEEALRKLIADQATSRARAEPFQLPDFAYAEPGLREGVDIFDADQMAELMGDEDRGALP